MFRPMATLATVAVLAAGVAACGDDDESAAASAAAQPEPGRADRQPSRASTTEVALDGGFVDALGTLKLTPAPVGDGKITKAGVARFPITGGNVTYYEPGSVSPFVQGEIDHDGSGLSLTGGGKTVELTDFVVDPGASVLTGKVDRRRRGRRRERAAVLPRRPHAAAAARPRARPPCSRARRSSSRTRPRRC